MWTYEDVSKRLWGIGTTTEEVLHGMGLFSLKDVVKMPKELLIKRFGKVKGEESYLVSHMVLMRAGLLLNTF
ncbi:hypothetical protein CN997_00185 [Bacillus cereus]|nr:hypothetical protein CN997_00185 [Bacillus cereus]